MESAMSKRNWSDILQAQRDGGLSIEAFCRAQNLARSNFYTARARVQVSDAAKPRPTVDVEALAEAQQHAVSLQVR